MGTESQTAAPVTRHDPAFSDQQGTPFAIGVIDRGMLKGTQAQYKRESRMVSAGFPIQPALHGQFIHPIPPTKGDRR